MVISERNEGTEVFRLRWNSVNIGSCFLETLADYLFDVGFWLPTPHISMQVHLLFMTMKSTLLCSNLTELVESLGLSLSF